MQRIRALVNDASEGRGTHKKGRKSDPLITGGAGGTFGRVRNGSAPQHVTRIETDREGTRGSRPSARSKARIRVWKCTLVTGSARMGNARVAMLTERGLSLPDAAASFSRDSRPRPIDRYLSPHGSGMDSCSITRWGPVACKSMRFVFCRCSAWPPQTNHCLFARQPIAWRVILIGGARSPASQLVRRSGSCRSLAIFARFWSI